MARDLRVRMASGFPKSVHPVYCHVCSAVSKYIPTLFTATYAAQSARTTHYSPLSQAHSLTDSRLMTFFVPTHRYASDAFFEATDAYFCSLGVLALACGFDPIGDPLGAWKRKFFRNGKTPPRDRNGKLHFRIEDVDVTVLDNNHAVLRKAWEVLAPRSSWEGIPECLRGVVFADHARYGLGPFPNPTLFAACGRVHYCNIYQYLPLLHTSQTHCFTSNAGDCPDRLL